MLDECCAGFIGLEDGACWMSVLRCHLTYVNSGHPSQAGSTRDYVAHSISYPRILGAVVDGVPRYGRDGVIFLVLIRL